MISCICKQNCRFIKINSIAIMCLYCTCIHVFSSIIINNNNKYHQLDPLGHHAVTCKEGGDVVMRHNALRDVFFPILS